jgi:Fe-S-cluster containining protein
LATARSILGAVVTDLVEIRRLAADRQAENLDFRRYLSAHHHPIEQFQILAAEIQQHIDCTTCANCCRYSIVAVSASEIEAIAKHMGAPVDDVMHRYTVADPEASGLRVLASTKDGCVFLQQNRCTIYEARPQACRDFPHVVPGTHSLGARLSSLCRWASLCPIIYNALESYKHVVGYRHSTGNLTKAPSSRVE